MTCQAPETLYYQGQPYLIKEKPLEMYFRKEDKRPPFIVDTTICWRGYVGEWSLDDGRLRLIAIEGLLALGAMVAKANEAYRFSGGYKNNPDLCREVTLADIFPSYGDGVFADWYSGQIIGTSKGNDTRDFVATVRQGIVEHIEFAPSAER